MEQILCIDLCCASFKLKNQSSKHQRALFLISSVSLKETWSLLELEQQLNWIRAEVEASSRRSLSWYLLADDENVLADQVTAQSRFTLPFTGKPHYRVLQISFLLLL